MNYQSFTPEIDTLPSPAEMARTINEKTLPVSLRINEKTQAFFDSQATIYGVSGNVMMSLLLDRYVDYQDNVAAKSEELNFAILRKHLERCAKIVKKTDNPTLLQNLFNEGDSLAAMNANPEDIESILQDYAVACDGNPEHRSLDLRVWTVDAEFHCIEDDHNRPAYLSTDYADEMQGYYYDLYIGPQKWPIVVYLAKAYEFKVQQLFPGADELQTYRRATLGKQFYKELIGVINFTDDRAELARKIASAYLAAQGIEEIAVAESSPSDSTPMTSLDDLSDQATQSVHAGDAKQYPTKIDYNSLVFAAKSGSRQPVVNNAGLTVQALEQLGGVQHFHKIVDRAQAIRLQKYPDLEIPKQFDAVISNTLQTHSSDLRSYNGRDDYFFHPAPGYWGLRPNVRSDQDGNVIVD